MKKVYQISNEYLRNATFYNSILYTLLKVVLNWNDLIVVVFLLELYSQLKKDS